jgi:hypothetical protein
VAKGTTFEKAGKPKAADKRVFSPVRDPLGNIMGADVAGMLTVLSSQLC